MTTSIRFAGLASIAALALLTHPISARNTLRFLGERMTPQGKLNVRLSFTPLAPNRVRQHAENSTDGGATWTTVYDFLYLRQGSGEKP